jgi:hypothetical protein
MTIVEFAACHTVSVPASDSAFDVVVVVGVVGAKVKAICCRRHRRRRR